MLRIHRLATHKISSIISNFGVYDKNAKLKISLVYFSRYLPTIKAAS